MRSGCVHPNHSASVIGRPSRLPAAPGRIARTPAGRLLTKGNLSVLDYLTPAALPPAGGPASTRVRLFPLHSPPLAGVRREQPASLPAKPARRPAPRLPSFFRVLSILTRGPSDRPWAKPT